MSCCTVASFVRLLRLVNCLFIFMAACSKFVTNAIKGCIHVCGDGKGRNLQPRPVEHNFRHKAVVLRVTFKNIILKFWSIMYLTLRRVLRGQLFSPKGKFNYLKVFFNLCTLFFQYVWLLLPICLPFVICGTYLTRMIAVSWHIARQTF